jgi:hypothetical protein
VVPISNTKVDMVVRSMADMVQNMVNRDPATEDPLKVTVASIKDRIPDTRIRDTLEDQVDMVAMVTSKDTRILNMTSMASLTLRTMVRITTRIPNSSMVGDTQEEMGTITMVATALKDLDMALLAIMVLLEDPGVLTCRRLLR